MDRQQFTTFNAVTVLLLFLLLVGFIIIFSNVTKTYLTFLSFWRRFWDKIIGLHTEHLVVVCSVGLHDW